MLDINLIANLFIFIFPFALVNIFASFSRHFKIKFLEKSLDFGIKIKNKRLLGNNKTFRGAIFGIIFGIIGVYLVHTLTANNIINQNIFLFQLHSPLFYGIIGSLGVIIGDLTESIIKRRLNIKPGEVLHFFDQSDWVIGLIIFTVPFINISNLQIILLLIFIPIFHYIINYLGYKLKLEENKF